MVPISQAAQAKGFYSAETERELARNVETPANSVISKLINCKAIAPAERAQLAYYIGVMLKRIPARRRKSMAMIPDVLADVVAETREKLARLAELAQADPELLAQGLQDLDTAAGKLALEPPAGVMDQINEPWPSEQMVHALYGMSWRVIESHGPQYFITTDNPAFFFGG